MGFLENSMALSSNCKTCGCELEYDVTTVYDDNLKTHVCMECGRPVNE